MKTRYLVFSILAAALLSLGAVAYADSTTTTQTATDQAKTSAFDSATQQGIISQDQATKLKDYSSQYYKDQRAKKMQDRLDAAVKAGTITQDEANQIKDWQSKRPLALDKLGGHHIRGGMMR